MYRVFYHFLGFGLGGTRIGIKQEIFWSLEYTGKKYIYSCDTKCGFYITRKRRHSLYRESSLYIYEGLPISP